METAHCSFVRFAVAVTLAVGVMQAAAASAAANARPSPDRVADAKAAVLRILRDRASSLGLADVIQRPFAVCGWVHVRNANGEDGRRQFVYSLVSEQAHILDLPAYPDGARAAFAKIRHYCR